MLYGDAGNDRLEARDKKRDVLDGGAGTDTARIDKKLDKAKRVERLVR